MEQRRGTTGERVAVASGGGSGPSPDTVVEPRGDLREFMGVCDPGDDHLGHP